jgi:hypothetical protein
VGGQRTAEAPSSSRANRLRSVEARPSRSTPQKMNPPAWLGKGRRQPATSRGYRGSARLLYPYGGTRLGRPWLAARPADAEALAAPLLTQAPHESVAGREGHGNVGERLFGRASLCPAPGSKCVNATLPLPALPVWSSVCSFGFRRTRGSECRLKRVQARYGRRQEQVKGGSDQWPQRPVA